MTVYIVASRAAARRKQLGHRRHCRIDADRLEKPAQRCIDREETEHDGGIDGPRRQLRRTSLGLHVAHTNIRQSIERPDRTDS
jgi:hypothetical protein